MVAKKLTASFHRFGAKVAVSKKFYFSFIIT